MVHRRMGCYVEIGLMRSILLQCQMNIPSVQDEYLIVSRVFTAAVEDAGSCRVGSKQSIPAFYEFLYAKA